MGLMDPEELSCSRVGTDKGPLINSPGFPEEQIGRDGNLTASNHEGESADNLASTIVSDILDESIDLFNRCDGTNVRNNNTEGANISNTSLSNTKFESSDYSDKTDRVVELSCHLEPSDVSNCETVINFDNFTSPVVTTVDSAILKNCGDMLLSAACTNDNSGVRVSSVSSTSSEDDSESPVLTDSESSLSRSNENIPAHFSNVYISKKDSLGSRKMADNSQSGEISAQNDSNDASQQGINNGASSNVPSAHRNLVQINGCLTDDVSGPHQQCSDSSSVFSQSAVPQVTDSVHQHSCLDHPDVLELRNQYEEMKLMLQMYKDKAER